MCPACTINFGTDCRGDFDARGDRARSEEASCEERHEENPPRAKGEFTMTKRTLTMTSSSRKVARREGDEGVEFETAAVLASASPSGMMTMGTFPLSLIALGQIRRRHFDDTLTLQSKRTISANEELESPQQVGMTALTGQIEATKPGARPCPPSIIRQGQGWLAVFATVLALVALFLVAMLPR
jgi:hypothetical protein